MQSILSRWSTIRQAEHVADESGRVLRSERVLVEVGRVEKLTVAELKSVVGLNYKALAQAIQDLVKSQCVTVALRHQAAKDNFEPEDVVVIATESGIRKACHVLASGSSGTLSI